MSLSRSRIILAVSMLCTVCSGAVISRTLLETCLPGLDVSKGGFVLQARFASPFTGPFVRQFSHPVGD